MSKTRKQLSLCKNLSGVLTRLDDLNLHIFSFLTAEEITIASRTCHAFSEIKKSTAHQIFYIVGKKIFIAEMFRDVMVPRSDISSAELKQSYPKEGNVKVFTTEKEATLYARSLRKWPGASTASKLYLFEVNQPGVFQVQCVLQVLPQLLTEKIVITPYIEQPIIRQNGELMYPERKNALVNFFETNTNNLIPIKGEVKIEYDEQYEEYGSCTWREKSRKCLVM